MSIDLRDIIRQITPLFEEKLKFMKEMQERKLTSEENIEASKINLKYGELEAKIKNDKDTLAWEKDKAILGFKNGLDIQTLHNQGLVNVANIQRMSAKDQSLITAEAAKYGHDMTAFNQALQYAGTTQKEVKTNPDTGEKTEVSTTANPLAAGMVPTIAKRVGMGAKEVSPDVLAQHTNALAEQQKTGGDVAVEGYLRNLSQSDPDAYTALRSGQFSPAPATQQPAPVPVTQPQPQPAGRTPQSPVVQPQIASKTAAPITAAKPVENPERLTLFGTRSPLRFTMTPQEVEEAKQDMAKQMENARAATAQRQPLPAPVSIGGMFTGLIPKKKKMTAGSNYLSMGQ